MVARPSPANSRFCRPAAASGPNSTRNAAAKAAMTRTRNRMNHLSCKRGAVGSRQSGGEGRRAGTSGAGSTGAAWPGTAPPMQEGTRLAALQAAGQPRRKILLAMPA